MPVHAVVIEILIPIVVGFLLRVVGLFGDAESAVLRKFVVYVTIPLLVFHSMYTARLPSAATAVSVVAALPLLTLLFYLIGAGAAKVSSSAPSRRAALAACITFGNYGWLGWSAVYTILGEQALNQAFFFTLLWWPVFYGFCALIGSGFSGRGGIDLKTVVHVTSLPVCCISAGILLNAAHVGIPSFILTPVRSIGDATIPLILISVGMGLFATNIRRLLVPALLVSAIRLGLGPLIGILVVKALPVGELGWSVILLESAMPVATVTPILGDYFDLDRQLVSVCIVTSTVLSLVTLPIVIGILF